MDQDEFMKLQYQTIRKEIEDTRERIFKMAAFGIVIVPGAQMIAQYQLHMLLYFIPFVIIGIVFVHMAEKTSLMRCGSFIKENIERNELSELSERGWEHWLENDPSNRKVDKYITFAFFILFVTYYTLSVFMISDIQDPKVTSNVGFSIDGIVIVYKVVIFYAIIGIVVLGVVIWRYRDIIHTLRHDNRESDELHQRIHAKDDELRQVKDELRQVKDERDELRQLLRIRPLPGWRLVAISTGEGR